MPGKKKTFNDSSAFCAQCSMRELSEEARKAGNYGAAVNAEHHVGKALGHYVDKIEVTGRDSSAERILKEWKKARGVENETQTRH